MITNDRWGPLPDKADREKFDFTVWRMQRTEPAWGMMYGKMNVRVDTRTPLVSVAILPGGVLTLGVNFDVFRELPDEAKRACLELTAQKVLNGQLSSMGKRIEKQYGEMCSEMGLLIYLSKYVEHKALTDAGFCIPTPAMYNLQKDQSWEFYASELKKRLDVEEGQRNQAMLAAAQAGQLAGDPTTADPQQPDPAQPDGFLPPTEWTPDSDNDVPDDDDPQEA